MSYRITGLSPEPFAGYWKMTDSELATYNIRRLRADSDRGFPCRISLQDARAGESLLLLPYTHHDVAGPYRASGPIFVRECALESAVYADEVPAAFRRRLISVRAYDAGGWMLDAEVVEGQKLDVTIRRHLQEDAAAYLHLHNAKPGCFAARVDRISRDMP